MAGYSTKPLLEKLGPTADGKAMLILFTSSRVALSRRLSRLAKLIHPDGALWIAWPTASGVVTDLTERVVRDAGLRHGLVDVKVAALDDVWSGLKFVFRLRNRSSTRGYRRAHRGERLAVS